MIVENLIKSKFSSLLEIDDFGWNLGVDKTLPFFVLMQRTLWNTKSSSKEMIGKFDLTSKSFFFRVFIKPYFS